MTGPQKMEYVRGQIEKLRAGKSDSLKCPYCKGESIDPVFCCEAMKQACAAVMARKLAEGMIGHAAKIAARHANN